MFSKQIKVLTNTDAGESIGRVASGITMLFGAMAIFTGLMALAVGVCFTKCDKVAKCCSIVVSTLSGQGRI
jgi:hypothetical protein